MNGIPRETPETHPEKRVLSEGEELSPHQRASTP